MDGLHSSVCLYCDSISNLSLRILDVLTMALDILRQGIAHRNLMGSSKLQLALDVARNEQGNHHRFAYST